MAVQPKMATLQRFFSGLAEQTFEAKLGVVDPPLVDYLSGLLVQYVHTEQVHPLRTATHEPLQAFHRLSQEAETRVDSARRRIHRYIGDIAMFWAGLFPESLRQTRNDADLNRFDEYCLTGKRSYLIASSIPTNQTDAAADDVLERLGLRFEMCALRLARSPSRMGTAGSRFSRSLDCLIA